jgi:asparagine synthase (glutamine-hydrolysing)
MCGIAGFIDSSLRNSKDMLNEAVGGMVNVLQHRGPQDEGVWADAAAGVAIGHCRLAILDISQEGHQPMCSADARYVITFNGEIYNFQDLRRELEPLGHTFRGHSDTEVMLAGVMQWGVLEAVRRFNGMFAFGIWDRQERCLWLARDRAGEKPLYYGSMQGVFLYASELKALTAHPKFTKEVDPNSLACYLRLNYVPGPHSIYKGIQKLMPGTLLRFSTGAQTTSVKTYWSAKTAMENGLDRPFRGSAPAALEALKDILFDSVRMRMIADVPVGAFLSGGIDSSVIVALMQSAGSVPVKSFTIGFEDARFDEAFYAREVARHLGTDHHEMRVTAADAIRLIPRIPTIYDEPFADPSQIPTYIVSTFARRHVTVALSGDAGDELFCGYNSYRRGNSIYSKMRLLPPLARKMAAMAIGCIPESFVNAPFSMLDQLFNYKPRVQTNPAGRMRKLARMLNTDNAPGFHHVLSSCWLAPQVLMDGSSEHATAFTDPKCWISGADIRQTMMYLDMVTYLPDDILVKVDRAAMAVSLETRVPLLDHRVIEFACSLPMSLKVNGGVGKSLLRKLAYDLIPESLINRPKQGFGVPIGDWLRTDLRPWAEDLLSESAIKRVGFLNSDLIRRHWHDHLKGRYDFASQLWNILMWQAWAEAQPVGNLR